LPIDRIIGLIAVACFTGSRPAAVAGVKMMPIPRAGLGNGAFFIDGAGTRFLV